MGRAIHNLFIPEGVLVMTVALMGWMWRLRVWWDEHWIPGSFRQDPRALRPARRKAVRQPAGQSRSMSRKPKPPQKRGRGLRQPPGRHDRHFRVGCVHATLRYRPLAYARGVRHSNHATGMICLSFAPSCLTYRKRHNRFHSRRTRVRRSLTSEYEL